MAPDPSNQYHSPFVYCGNNPSVYIDDDGEWAHIAAGGAIGGVSAAISAYKQGLRGKYMAIAILAGAGAGAAFGATFQPTGVLSAGAAATALFVGLAEGTAGDIVGQGVAIGLTDKTLSDFNITSTLTSSVTGGLSAFSAYPLGMLKSPILSYPSKMTLHSAWGYLNGWIISTDNNQQIEFSKRLEALETEITIFQRQVDWASRRMAVPAPETNLDYQSTTITEPPTYIGPCTNDDKNEVEF
jgi:hypothetical protein